MVLPLLSAERSPLKITSSAFKIQPGFSASLAQWTSKHSARQQWKTTTVADKKISLLAA
jgi:hypothetical protein